MTWKNQIAPNKILSQKILVNIIFMYLLRKINNKAWEQIQS